jgi:NADP-dependent 3-hydroxy acid dehydrogenase YdfG
MTATIENRPPGSDVPDPGPARPIAVVTGASAGIGAASARRLAQLGYQVVLGARRAPRLEKLARDLDGIAVPLDVTDPASVEQLASRLPRVNVLINNAGLGKGLDPIETSSEDDWRAMLETNVMGLYRVTRALLPAMGRVPHAHIVNLGSIAGFEVYPGGGGYTASKHAVRAITKTLRLELVGRPIRITEVNPGMVETEFSLIRFHGDAERAARVYQGLQPLSADDIADCVAWAVSRPPHVNVDEIVIKPVAQASVTVAARAGVTR